MILQLGIETGCIGQANKHPAKEARDPLLSASCQRARRFLHFEDVLARDALAPHAVLRIEWLEHVLVAEVPFADDGRGVTLFLEQLRQRLFIRVQAVVVARKEDRSLFGFCVTSAAPDAPQRKQRAQRMRARLLIS